MEKFSAACHNLMTVNNRFLLCRVGCKAGRLGAPCRAPSTGYAWWGAGMPGARGMGYGKWETCVLLAWGLRDSMEGYITG